MYGGAWNWCDAMSAIGAILTPVIALGVAKHWFGEKRDEKIKQEEVRNMEDDEAPEQDVLYEFWCEVQRRLLTLSGRNIPTRKFWSLPFKNGMRFAYVVTDKKARVEIYIDNGDAEWNLQQYDMLRNARQQIERSVAEMIDESVVWRSRPNSRAKGISIEYAESGLQERVSWPNVISFFERAAPVLQRVVANVLS